MLDWTAFGLECDNKTKFHLTYGDEGMSIKLIGTKINTYEFVSRREDFFDKIDNFNRWNLDIISQEKIQKKNFGEIWLSEEQSPEPDFEGIPAQLDIHLLMKNEIFDKLHTDIANNGIEYVKKLIIYMRVSKKEIAKEDCHKLIVQSFGVSYNRRETLDATFL